MEALKLLTDAAIKLLVGYIDLVIDVLTLRGLDSHRLAGVVSPSLLSYFIVGAAIAYFLTKGSLLPGLTPVAGDSEERRSLDRMIFGLVIVGIFIYTGICHAILLCVSLWNSSSLGGIRDTLNANLAVAATMLPAFVLSHRAGILGVLFLSQRPQGKGARAGALLISVTYVMLLVILAYHGLVLSHVHTINWRVGFLPSALLAAFTIGNTVISSLAQAKQRARRERELRESSAHSRPVSWEDLEDLLR
jgi:hypothetical protein